MMLVNCPNVIWGIPPEIKPLDPVPEGKVKWRFRGEYFAFAVVRGLDGHCRWAAIRDNGETWSLDYDVAYPSHRQRDSKLQRDNNALRTQIDGLKKYGEELWNECAQLRDLVAVLRTEKGETP